MSYSDVSVSRSIYIDAANSIRIHCSGWNDVSPSLKTQAQAWLISSWENDRYLKTRVLHLQCSTLLHRTHPNAHTIPINAMRLCSPSQLGIKRPISRPIPRRAPIPLPNQALPLNLCRTCMCQCQKFSSQIVANHRSTLSACQTCGNTMGAVESGGENGWHVCAHLSCAAAAPAPAQRCPGSAAAARACRYRKTPAAAPRPAASSSCGCCHHIHARAPEPHMRISKSTMHHCRFMSCQASEHGEQSLLCDAHRGWYDLCCCILPRPKCRVSLCCDCPKS